MTEGRDDPSIKNTHIGAFKSWYATVCLCLEACLNPAYHENYLKRYSNQTLQIKIEDKDPFVRVSTLHFHVPSFIFVIDSTYFLMRQWQFDNFIKCHESATSSVTFLTSILKAYQLISLLAQAKQTLKSEFCVKIIVICHKYSANALRYCLTVILVSVTNASS